MTENDPYNPLDKFNLGHSIAQALLETPAHPLADTGHLGGAGVYAIYYTGDFPAYAPIAEMNRGDQFTQPIYVGKAIPKGGRKGGLTLDASKGKALRDRLRIHANSITEASNLNLDDFWFRCLVVDDIWIPLGENVLIEAFKPVWNMIVDGFGNKTPGRRRATQYRSAWDVLHPGRKFAEMLAPGTLTPSDVVAKLDDYFSGRLQPSEPIEDDQNSEGED